jgi:hypothetical protein
MHYGSVGKNLEINLSTGKSHKTAVDTTAREMYLGGFFLRQSPDIRCRRPYRHPRAGRESHDTQHPFSPDESSNLFQFGRILGSGVKTRRVR